jgi:signal transduction histidine kinase
VSGGSREFIPIVHELRGLVAATVGFTELLRTKRDEETLREAAARLSEVVERLRTTLERVLAEVEADPAVSRRLRELQ